MYYFFFSNEKSPEMETKFTSASSKRCKMMVHLVPGAHSLSPDICTRILNFRTHPNTQQQTKNSRLTK